MAFGGSQKSRLFPHGVMGPAAAFGPKGASTLNLRIKLDSVVLLATGDVAPPASGSSDIPWRMECVFICRRAGALGLVMATGSYDNGNSAGLLANTAAVSVDGTVAHDIEVSAQHGTADPGNIVTVQNITVEKFDPA